VVEVVGRKAMSILIKGLPPKVLAHQIYCECSHELRNNRQSGLSDCQARIEPVCRGAELPNRQRRSAVDQLDENRPYVSRVRIPDFQSRGSEKRSRCGACDTSGTVIGLAAIGCLANQSAGREGKARGGKRNTPPFAAALFSICSLVHSVS
jgi:hypothetical protein